MNLAPSVASRRRFAFRLAALGIVLSIFVTGQAKAAVTVDATSQQSSPSGTTNFTFNHVLGTGTGRLLVCGVSISQNDTAIAPIATSISFGGTAMTLAVQTPSHAQASTAKISGDLFYLTDTALGSLSGSQTVAVTFGSAPTGPVVAGCASFFGMQSAAPETTITSYLGSAGNASAMLNAANAGDLVIDLFAGGGTSSKTAAANTGQTGLYSLQLLGTSTLGSNASVYGGTSYVLPATAGSVTVGWTNTESRYAYAAAVFAAIPPTTYTVTTSVSPAGAGTVSLSPNQSTYNSGTTVQVTATPAIYYTFTGFSGDLSGTTNPASLIVNSNKSITANFAPAQCTLTMVDNGHGTITPNSGTYNCGSTITLSATPDSGYAFGSWSGAGYTGSTAGTTFTLTQNTTETASFVAGTSCTLGTSVTGSGNITLSPAGGTYSCGSSVQVTATPSTSDYTFQGFTGALTGTTNPQTLVLNSNSSVAATFTQTSFPVTVTIVGHGTVTPSPSASSYPKGSTVQLTATPNSGAHFIGFTGDITSTTNPLSVTVNSAVNLTATFADDLITQDSVSHAATTGTASTLSWQHTLSAGPSRGVIIAIGSTDGTASPDASAVVNSVLFNGVYATPIPNSLIYGGTSGMVQTQLFYLTDAELPGAGTYTIQVNLAGSISGFQAGAVSLFGVNQGPPEAVLTHRDTSGADLISSTITTLTNNAWVFDIVEDNNIAALTANSGQNLLWSQSSALSGSGGSSVKPVPTAGATTLGWAGSASRLTHSLAAFPPASSTVPPTYTLNTTTTGTGTVATNPGITQFPTQTAVLLTAAPGLGFSFSGWSGDVTSTANPLQVVMDANKNIVANFTSAPTCTLTTTIVGSGSVTPSSGTYNCGTVIHFAATPSTGYTFDSYSGDFSSPDNPADFTITANSNVTVQFDQIPYCNLTVNSVGSGTVTPSSGSFACGSVITLQAAANAGYGFSGFTGDISSTSNPTTFVLDSSKTITATFTQGSTCTLTANTVGSGSISPASGTYACGTTLTMQATPAAKYLFSGWSGALTGATTPTPLTLDTNKTVTATFAFNTAGVTGDARTVTEPSYPPVCTTLTALQSVSSPNESAPDTARIQAALNACPAGQAVEFSSNGASNAFIIAPITVPKGVTMLLDADITILASIKYADYACVTADSFCTSLISIATNADPAPGSGIMGLGVIDGRGGVKLTDKSTSWWGSGSDARPRLIYIGNRSPQTYADNFTLYKVTLQNSPKFHVSGTGNNLTVWGIKILTPADSPNTDGIDPSGSKNITITNSYISDGDDMIAVKAGVGHVSNVTISNNHLYTGHGISVGSETNAGLNNMLVHDNAIDNGFGGSSSDSIRIKSDVSRGGEVYDVLYKNTCVNHGGDTLVFDPYYSSKTGSLVPNFHDITIINFHELIRDSSHKVTMQGYNTAGTVYPLTLTLNNVYFDGATANDFKAPDQTNNAQFTLGPDPVNISSFLIADAAVPANNITVTNNVANSNAAYDCTNAFVYLNGDLAAPKGTITTGSSPIVTAVIQNVVAPAVAGTISYPQQNKPTGTINLLENGSVVASGSITGRLANITIPNITSGTHTYTAQYTGDTNYPGGLAFGSLTINAATSITPPVANAQSVSVGYNTPKSITLTATGGGSIVYTVLTQPANGTLSGTAPNVIYTPGNGYTGTDSFTFKANNGADSNTATVSITVGAASTSLTLATPVPSTGLVVNQTTTLTATLSPVTAGATLATGGITFSDNSSAICSNVAFNPSTGVATCNTPTLSAGSHSFTAAYAGDAHFTASNSTAQVVNVTVAPGSIAVSGFPAAAHIGVSYPVTVTINDSGGTPITGYTGTVQLSSSDTFAVLPAPYTFQPSENGVHTFNVTLNTGGSQTITATANSISGSETGIVVDNYVWLVNANGTLSKLNETGATIMSPIGTAGTVGTRASVAIDHNGSAWAVDNATSSILFSTNTGLSQNTYTGGGLNAPVSVFIDGAGQAWVINSNNSLSVFSNAGTPVSPAAGYAAATTNMPSPLNAPSGLAVDSSGSLWITNSGNGTVTKVFGVAAPVVTPTSNAVTNNTLGVQP